MDAVKTLKMKIVNGVPTLIDRILFKGVWVLEAVDSEGRLKWREEIHNIVVTEGLNNILDVTFGAATKPAGWYIGLIEGATAPIAGDTLASHGFLEYTAYTGDRKQWITGTASGGTISTLDPASRAEFDFTETKDITGIMLTDQQTGNVGVLYSAGLLVTPKTLNNGDTLRVHYTLNAVSA